MPEGTLSKVADPRLPDGDYRTPEVTRDQLVAAAVDAGFPEEEVQSWLDAALPGFEGTLAFGLRIADGNWSQYQIVNGGLAEVGSQGTYEIIDNDTMTATELPPHACQVTYTYKLDGEQLTIDAVDACNEDLLLVITFIYEAAPFTLQPDGGAGG
jgi:hypothetical protein